MTQMPSWMPDQPGQDRSSGSRRRMVLFAGVAIVAVIFAVGLGLSMLLNIGPAAGVLGNGPTTPPHPSSSTPPRVFDPNAVLGRTFTCDSPHGPAFSLSFDATASIYTVTADGEQTGLFEVTADPTVIEYKDGPLAGTTSKSNQNIASPRLRFSGEATAFPSGTAARCMASG